MGSALCGSGRARTCTMAAAGLRAGLCLRVRDQSRALPDPHPAVRPHRRRLLDHHRNRGRVSTAIRDHQTLARAAYLHCRALDHVPFLRKIGTCSRFVVWRFRLNRSDLLVVGLQWSFVCA